MICETAVVLLGLLVLTSAQVLDQEQVNALTGVYEASEMYVTTGQLFDDIVLEVAQGSLNVSEAVKAMKSQDVDLRITILLVDPVSGNFGGYKRAVIPGVVDYPIERIMGRASPIDSDSLRLVFQESADTAHWEGIMFVSNGTTKLSRVEGLEVLEDDKVIDNQATSYFVMQKDPTLFDPVKESKDIAQLLDSIGRGPLPGNSGYTCGLTWVLILAYTSFHYL